MKKKLVLITANFPYGTSETFLETELPILAQNFENIEIFTFSTKGQERQIPTNCSVTNITFNTSRFKAYLGVFSILFWKEIFIIKSTYKKEISLGILKTILISLMRAKKIANFLNNTITDKKGTIYYSYWCDDSALALALLNYRDEQPFKTVSRSHGWDVYFEVSDYNYLPFRHFIHSNLSQIFTISEKGKKYIEETWKVKGKITVSKLGVKPPPIENLLEKSRISEGKEEGQFHPSNTSIQEGNNKDVFTLISCSNLIPLKRVHLIIEALSLLQSEKIHWVHFGDGPEEKKLKELAHKNLSGNISYEFKGRVKNIEVLCFYNSIKPQLFINVSSSEGIPVSIMEAMSFGIPCIATNVGGNSEIVNQKNGVLISKDAPINDVKDAILKIVDSSIENQLLFKKEAYATWENNYNSETNYKNFIKSIKNLT